MTRTQIQTLRLHLLAVEIFLYKHRRELPVEHSQVLSKQNSQMIDMLNEEEICATSVSS